MLKKKFTLTILVNIPDDFDINNFNDLNKSFVDLKETLFYK